jgi:lipopolysaccharide export system protein LptA
MRVTIKGLRLWILAATGLLLVVVAGFIFYGRYRFRHIEKDLPGRLGINIQQTANGFTFSQANGPHTLFVLKAAKQVQMKSGHVLLHDVDITLYGPPGSGRTDRIYGSDFDFDQNTQTATSQGDVNIELEGMGNAANGATPAAAPGASSNTIRVRTRGLVFEQKTGDAATPEPVEFQLPRAAGTSVGANYNSKTGVLVLDSAVKIITSSNGRAAVINAEHATLLRDKMQGFLTNATMEYETEDGSADAATLFFRKDGTTQKIDAQGHVRMKTDTGATMASDTAHILMDAKSQPTQADLAGGVAFGSARGGDSMHGTSRESTLHFATVAGANGKLQTALTHAQFRQDVHFIDATVGLAKDPRGHAERQVQGETVDVDFAPPGPQGETEARNAVADGNPVVTMRQMPSKGPSTSTRISGDHLVATLDPGNLLRQLDGNGNTRVVDESTDGARDTSQGDVLHTTFQQQPAIEQSGAEKPRRNPAHNQPASNHRPSQTGPKMQTSIDSATQDGHVILTELPAKKLGSTTQPATLTGWADHAEYHASDQVLHMTGRPRISDGESMQVSAELIDYHRDSQDAAAKGNVKATYTEQPKPPGTGSPSVATPSAPPSMGGNGPVHVIADHAAMHHATNQNDFYGTVKVPARLWQDTDSLTAPVIEIDRNKNLLKAWGENTGTEPVVQANFTSAMGAKHEQSVAQVHSQTLIYSDKDRLADFRGTVSMEQTGEVTHADDGLVYLKPAPKPAPTGGKKPAASPSSQGPASQGQNSQIDHLVATGHVVFTQPGRKGDGEKLVYTADDGRYVLTGAPQAPPHLWDRVHGTTTGTALLFNSQDGSVEVNGGQSSAVTDTRAPK